LNEASRHSKHRNAIRTSHYYSDNTSLSKEPPSEHHNYHPTIRRTPTYDPPTTKKNTINQINTRHLSILHPLFLEKNTHLENNIQPLLHPQITKTIQDGIID